MKPMTRKQVKEVNYEKPPTTLPGVIVTLHDGRIWIMGERYSLYMYGRIRLRDYRKGKKAKR